MKNHNVPTAIKWSVLGYNIPQAVSFAVNIYIARLLAPTDFGVLATATIIIYFLQDFFAGGLTTALIQKQGSQDEINKAANFIFTVNLAISVFLMVFIILTAPLIANFFHSPSSRPVVVSLAPVIFIYALGTVQLAILKRNMDFKTIFFRQLTPVIAQIIVMLPLIVIYHFGIWALVIGRIVSEILAVIILWIGSPWKPRFNFDHRLYRDLLRFGLFVMLTSILAWILTQADSIIVGKFLLISDLGLYNTGSNLVNKIYLAVILPILPVYYAKSCLFSTNEEKVQYYSKLKQLLSFLVLPILVGLILMSPFVEHLILGSKWKGMGNIITFLAISGVINLWALISGFLKSMGKPEVDTQIALITVCVCLPVWLFFVRAGLNTFLYARIGTTVAAILIYTGFEIRELKTSVFGILSFYHKAAIATAVMALAGFLLNTYVVRGHYNMLSLLLMMVSCTVVYFVSTRIVNRSILSFARSNFISAIKHW